VNKTKLTLKEQSKHRERELGLQPTRRRNQKKTVISFKEAQPNTENKE